MADYFDMDPSIVRILWAVLALVTGGIFLVLYIVMWIVVPEGPSAATVASVRRRRTPHSARRAGQRASRGRRFADGRRRRRLPIGRPRSSGCGAGAQAVP